MKLTEKEVRRLVTAYRLSPREVQVLEELLDGAPTNDDIAANLGTTVAAVGAAVQSLFAKTRTRARHDTTTVALLHLLHEEIREALDAAGPQDYGEVLRAMRARLRDALTGRR